MRGQRVDVQAIAGGLGLSRTTVRRWFGSRDDLLGEVVFAATHPLIEEEAERSGYQPPTDPETLAHAVVRLTEAFLSKDTTLRGTSSA